DEYVAALIEAAGSQEINRVPEELKTDDNRIDAQNLVSSVSSGATEAADTVVVEPGDTLSIIAGRVYGNPLLYRRLFEANRDRLTSPNAIKEGMVLRVPR
ncbi:MAG: LysM peptidoglycan-binding domain-containing protein, partial [Gemmatimonadetes bacterium]